MSSQNDLYSFYLQPSNKKYILPGYSNIKKEILNWFFDMNYEGRMKTLSVVNFDICHIIIKMYDKFSASHKIKFKINLKEKRPMINHRDFSEEYFSLTDSYRFRQKLLLDALRFYKIQQTNDAVTLSQELLMNPQAFCEIFDEISNNNFLKEICQVIFDQKQGVYTCNSPKWIEEKEYYNLGQIVIGYFENILNIKYALSKKKKNDINDFFDNFLQRKNLVLDLIKSSNYNENLSDMIDLRKIITDITNDRVIINDEERRIASKKFMLGIYKPFKMFEPPQEYNINNIYYHYKEKLMQKSEELLNYLMLFGFEEESAIDKHIREKIFDELYAIADKKKIEDVLNEIKEDGFLSNNTNKKNTKKTRKKKKKNKKNENNTMNNNDNENNENENNDNNNIIINNHESDVLKEKDIKNNKEENNENNNSTISNSSHNNNKENVININDNIEIKNDIINDIDEEQNKNGDINININIITGKNNEEEKEDNKDDNNNNHIIIDKNEIIEFNEDIKINNNENEINEINNDNDENNDDDDDNNINNKNNLSGKNETKIIENNNNAKKHKKKRKKKSKKKNYKLTQEELNNIYNNFYNQNNNFNKNIQNKAINGINLIQSTNKNSIKDKNEQLHNLILSFEKKIYKKIVSLHEIKYNSIVFLCQKIKDHFKSGLSISIYGSYSTGMELEESDIDISVELLSNNNNIDNNLNNSNKNNLNQKSIPELINELNLYLSKFPEFKYLFPIVNTKIPILKMKIELEKNIETKIDLTFNLKNTQPTINFYNNTIKRNPQIKPLTILIKYLVKKNKLASVFDGGFSSHSIFIMVASNVRVLLKNKSSLNLGDLLTSFLHFYGKVFNYTNTTIDLMNKNNPFIITEEFSKVPIFIDPISKANVSKSSFLHEDIKKLFSDTYDKLVQGEDNLNKTFEEIFF